ncbi:MAG TPA: glycine cleavage system protein GcvH [Dehalococcoidia bacterium]|nr:glycine cleavage system protein GcvH [Dehalococcoidia bacterium]
MSEATWPRDLRYNKEHQWVRAEGDVARSGITHFGQESLGDIVFVYLPKAGDKLNAGDKLLDIESTKVIWELFMPLTGEIVEVNQALDSSPETINQDPYGLGWVLAIRFDDASQLDALLDADAYAAFLASEKA